MNSKLFYVQNIAYDKIHGRVEPQSQGVYVVKYCKLEKIEMASGTEKQ